MADHLNCIARLQILLHLCRDLADIGCYATEVAALHAGIDLENRLDVGLVGIGRDPLPLEGRDIAEHAWNRLAAHGDRGGNRRVCERIQRVDFVFRRLHSQIIRNPGGRIGPEVGRNLLRRTQADIDVGGHSACIEAKLRGTGPIDLGVEGRRVDFLLQMRVDDAGYGGKPLLELSCNRKVVLVIAYRPDVDLRRQPEIEDLRHHIGGLEIEHVLRERSRQHLAQFLDVLGGRLVAILERHLDDAIVDSDRRAVGECQIVGSRRQPDIVYDQRALLFRNDFANLVLDRLENRLGAFDAGSGGSTNVKLDLAAVDEREKVPADGQEHHRAETNDEDCDDRNDGPPAKQHCQQFRVSITQALKVALEGCG